MGTISKDALTNVADRDAGVPCPCKASKPASLDDSGDQRSRLWRLTWWAMAWLAVVLPVAVGFGKVTGPQALSFVQWLLPVVLAVFGAVKAGQRVAGAALAKK